MTDSRAETAVQTVIPKSGRSTKAVEIPKADAPPSFEELDLDADVEVELVVEEPEALSQSREAETQAPAPEAARSPVDQILDELRAPLEKALARAQRIHGAEDRVQQWLDTQATRRLVRLAERFSDELEATEIKKASQPPPAPRKDSSIRDLIQRPHR